MKTIRWGVIGTGWISDKFATDMKSVADSQIVAVLSRTQQKAESFAASFNIPRPLHRSEEFFTDKDIDIVYVGTPHNEHFQDTINALAAGKHVLCEKPLAVNRQQAQQMIDMAREKNLFLMEAWWTAFMPALIKARELIAAGEIGELSAIQANLGFVLSSDPAGRILNPALAGGALLDVGIYPLQLANYIFGEAPQKVDARALMSATGVDEMTLVSAEYPGGCYLQAMCAMSRHLVNDARIYGSEGTIIIPADFHMADRCILARNGDEKKEFAFSRRTTGYDYEIAAVNTMLREGTVMPQPVTHDLTLTTIAMMDACRAQIGLVYPFE